MAITLNGNGTVTGLNQLNSGLGITEADQWRITSTLTNSGTNTISANWERNDTEFTKIGTGLTESSGVFTFPSTGVYKVEYKGTAYDEDDEWRYVGVILKVSSDSGSTYNERGYSFGAIINNNNNSYCNFSMSNLIDVTNASTYRFKFEAYSAGSVNYVAGTDNQLNGFTCIRLGDT